MRAIRWNMIACIEADGHYIADLIPEHSQGPSQSAISIMCRLLIFYSTTALLVHL